MSAVTTQDTRVQKFGDAWWSKDGQWCFELRAGLWDVFKDLTEQRVNVDEAVDRFGFDAVYAAVLDLAAREEER